MAGWKSYQVGKGGGYHVYFRGGKTYIGRQESRGFEIREILPTDAALLGLALITAALWAGLTTPSSPIDASSTKSQTTPKA